MSRLGARFLKRFFKWTSLLLIAGTSHATFSGYNYQRTITISTNSVSSGTSNYVNMPVLVSINDVSISTLTAIGHLLTGYDLIFSTASDCSTKMNFDQEAPNFSGYNVYNAWVQVPNISSSTATTFYMCYGNASVVTSQTNSTGTYDSNYSAVYHFPNGTGLTANDSTVNANNATGLNGTSATTGQIDGAASFNGSSNYIQVANASSLQFTNNVTLSAWVYLNSVTYNDVQDFFSKAGNYFLRETDSRGTSQYALIWFDGSNVDFLNIPTPTLSTWHYVVGVVSGNSPTQVYIDGSPVSGSTFNFAGSRDLTQVLAIGNQPSNSEYFNGNLDEMRIESSVRSADWVKTEYNNQSSPNTFETVGPENPSTPNTLSITVAGQTATQAILTYTAPDTNLCAVLVSQSSASYTPSVHDVDGSLFAGSNLDTRAGALKNGTSRIFVVGKRTSEQALDGNYYSRALQAYTTFYVKVICNGQTGTTSFQTNNIPLGDTHNEALPVDPNNPGTYAYPTLSTTDRTQTVVDNQTGLLIRRFEVAYDYTQYGVQPGGPPADHIDVCGQTAYTDVHGNTGYYCQIPAGNTYAENYFINSKTGAVSDLGNPVMNYPFYYNCIAQGFDQTNPRTWYCMVQENSYPVVVKATYTGDDSPVPHGQTMTAVTYTDLTPHSSGQDLYALFGAFDSSMVFTSDDGIQPSGFQDGAMLFHLLRNGGQDSYGYLMSFAIGDGTAVGVDTGSAHVQAITDTYTTYPMRWCALHVLQGNQTGNYNHYIQPQLNPMDFGNGTTPGGGPYWTNITDINGSGRTLLAATDVAVCPSTSPYVTPGESDCATITVNQQPMLPFPASGSGFLQTVSTGDILDVNDAGANSDEHFQVIAVSSLTWQIRRPNARSFTHSTSLLEAECGMYDITAGSEGALAQSAVWDTANDPYGIGGTTTIKHVYTITPNHFDYRPNAFVISGGNYIVAIGTYPAVTQSATQYSISQYPTFDGQSGFVNGNQINAHPAISLYAPSFFDGRPYFGASLNGPGSGAVAGQLYRFGSVAWGGSGTDINPLRPDILDTYAYCGDFPLKDVSSPSVIMTTDTTNNYEYCIAKKAGECYSGSSIGDVYVNCPGVTTTQCQNTGGATANYISPSITDICVISPSPYMMQTVEMSTATSYSDGSLGRRLTNSFNWYRRANVFESLYGINNNQQGIFYNPTAGQPTKVPGANNNYGSDLAFMVNLPPLPSTDTLNRSTYLPITLNLTPPVPNVNNALVQFGYGEYGPQSSYYCTSRQETCVAVSSYVVSATPIVYQQTDTYSGKSCSSGCTIVVPALPQHTTYMNVVYRDASNNILATQKGVASEVNTAFLSSGMSVPTFDDLIVGPQKWIGPSSLH